jgi:molybdopterin molybdotransferase
MSPSQHPNADVRMRGFVEKVSVEAAQTWLRGELEKLGPVASDEVSLDAMAGRVLSVDVVSKVNVPEFQRAMMDGFSVRASDTVGASLQSPVSLEVVGDVFPGQATEAKVTSGKCVRSMTGSQLPAGADAVLPVEQTSTDGERVLAQQSITAGRNVGRVGEDIRAGEVVLRTGRVLRPQDVGVLSSVGEGKISVAARPRVRIVVTGDELLPAGAVPRANRIVDSNGPMLAALISRDGGVPLHPGIVPDNREAILAALKDDAEVIVVSGGTSVGQEDYVPTLLDEYGELAIHGVAMRPASPIGMGRLDGRLVFLLPGNPVACLCGYDFFAGAAIRARGGRPTAWPYRTNKATLSTQLKSPAGRLDYVRMLVKQGRAEPVPKSGASVLSSTTRADGFVVIPADCTGYEAGDEVELFLYD